MNRIPVASPFFTRLGPVYSKAGYAGEAAMSQKLDEPTAWKYLVEIGQSERHLNLIESMRCCCWGVFLSFLPGSCGA